MINIPVSIGELIDKISILEIKTDRIKDESKRANCVRELEMLRGVAREGGVEYQQQKAELKCVNETLWEIEDVIRKKERAGEFDAEFNELARKVYKANDERSRIKKAINLLSKSEIVEEKEYVSYE